MGENDDAAHANSDTSPEISYRRSFAIVTGLFQLGMIILYGTTVRYGKAGYVESGDTTNPNATDLNGNVYGEGFAQREVDHYYPFYQDIHVMMFIGFGFLMTFLKKYGFSAVGYNFLITALCIQWSLLCMGFWDCVYFKEWHKDHLWGPHRDGPSRSGVDIDLFKLINADFAAAAVLITFGGILGKTSPTQLVVVVFFEIILYTMNCMINLQFLKVVDAGGSMTIHMFGAYFGLSLSMCLSRGTKRKASRDEYEASSALNSATNSSDTFAMIGTLFLWMYWPSFNAGIVQGSQQNRAIINTVLALCSSCIVAFIMDNLLRPKNKFSMVSIQNATLAGGVAMGSAADLMMEPWGAIVLGTTAGIISVVGYVYIQPKLQEVIGLEDTCGIHNLHAMPGFLGGLTSAIATGGIGDYLYGERLPFTFPARLAKDLGGEGRDRQTQAGLQVACCLITLGLALVGGAMTGFIIKMPCFLPPGDKRPWYEYGNSVKADKWFHDKHYWMVEEEDHVWHDGSYHKPVDVEEAENAAKELAMLGKTPDSADLKSKVAALETELQALAQLRTQAAAPAGCTSV